MAMKQPPPSSSVAALDAVLDAARALEQAETVQAERLAADQVRAAINQYDALIIRMARAFEEGR